LFETATYRGPFAEKSLSGDAKYRRNVGDILQGQSANFVSSTFAQYCMHVHFHPRLPAPSLTMAGFPFLTHAKTELLQDYQIQLQLRTIELHYGLRENMMISLV